MPPLMRRKGKKGKTKCQQSYVVIGMERKTIGEARNTGGDSSYNDTANALIKASKKSAIDGTRREIIGI